MNQKDAASACSSKRRPGRAERVAAAGAAERLVAELEAEIAALRCGAPLDRAAGAKAERALRRLRTELAAERARAEARRSLLIGELNHRVKNTLAVVQSLAAQTARRTCRPSPPRSRRGSSRSPARTTC